MMLIGGNRCFEGWLLQGRKLLGQNCTTCSGFVSLPACKDVDALQSDKG